MSFIRIYLPSSQIQSELNLNQKEIFHKLKNVLRLKEKEKVYLFDGQGKEYLYQIEKIDKNFINLKKINLVRNEEKIKKISLAFPLTKDQKVELILQRATELGVDIFYPFYSRYTLKKTFSSFKEDRFKKIIQEATRQSGRLFFPLLERPKSFKEILNFNFDFKIVCSFKGKKLINIDNIKNKNSFLILIGPEGDFSNDEYDLLEKNNFYFLKISPYILRMETAGIFAVGLLNYFLF